MHEFVGWKFHSDIDIMYGSCVREIVTIVDFSLLLSPELGYASVLSICPWQYAKLILVTHI